MALPVLHYFDLLSRAEPTRLLFIHSNTPFTDHRLSFPEWRSLKPSHFSEFDQLPRLDIDGLELVESKAIERYVAIKLGYYPSDLEGVYKVDSMMYLKEDFYLANLPFVLGRDTEGMEKWYAENAGRYLGYLNKRISDSQSGFFVGSRVTLADIEAFELLWDYFTRPGRAHFAHYLDEFPLLKEFMERMLGSSEQLKAYHATRGDKWA